MERRKRCERREFTECPYRREEIDYEHWIAKCGESLEFARERADILCNSTPCMYAIELNTQKAQAQTKMDYQELLRKYIQYVGDVDGTDFISNCDRQYVSDVKFSVQEWAEIVTLAEQVDIQRGK